MCFIRFSHPPTSLIRVAQNRRIVEAGIRSRKRGRLSDFAEEGDMAARAIRALLYGKLASFSACQNAAIAPEVGAAYSRTVARRFAAAAPSAQDGRRSELILSSFAEHGLSVTSNFSRSNS